MHIPRPLSINGLKHVGKSSVARLLARSQQAEWYDTDETILQLNSTGRGIEATSVRDLYHQIGKVAFQNREAQAVKWIINRITERAIRAVISTGGGLCDNADAYNTIRSSTYAVVLDEDPEILYQRISSRGIPAFLDPGRPYHHFMEIAQRRRARYLDMGARVIPVTGLTIAEIVDAITAFLEHRSEYGRE